MLIQSSILQVSNALTPVGSPYAPVIKGNSAAQSLEGFVFTALNAVTQAASTFTSQNMGKKDYQRVRRVLWTVSLMASGVAVLLSGLIIVLRDPLLVLYDVQKADDVLSMLAYDTAIKRVWWKWTSFILFGLMNSAAGVLRGMGKSTTSAAISLVGTCIFRVAWIYTVFRWLGTLEVIYISYGISWILTGAAFYICVGVILRMYIRGGTEINAVQES
jgi:Na+-driven multidrug efflux pump